MGKNIREMGLEDLVEAGLSMAESKVFHKILKEEILAGGRKGLISEGPREIWRKIVGEKKLLKPWHPHKLHQLVYYSVYSDWDSSINGPPPYWFPSL